MAIPDFQTLMLPVLRAAAEGEVRISAVVDRLAQDFALTPDERSQLLASGRQTTFANRVHWAKSYLSKAGLVELTQRAHFRITEQGKTVLASPPARIDIKFLHQFPEFQAFRSAQGSGKDEQDAAPADADTAPLPPDELMRSAQKQLEDALADELLQRVRSGTPAFFESLVVRLLVAMGYGGSVPDVDKALVVGGPGDGGIDGVIDQDALGLDRVYVQAKRYADGNNVGASDIRDFYGSLDMKKASKGVFVTSSSFSPSARQTADQLGKRIVLVDGLHLARLMIRHNVGCQVEETLTIKKLDEDFFEA